MDQLVEKLGAGFFRSWFTDTGPVPLFVPIRPAFRDRTTALPPRGAVFSQLIARLGPDGDGVQIRLPDSISVERARYT